MFYCAVIVINSFVDQRNTCPCCRYQLKAAESNDENNRMTDSDGEADGDYDPNDESGSDFSSDDGDDSNTFTTSYVYNNPL